VEAGLSVDDVVLGYKLLVGVIRDWIRERSVEVTAEEHGLLINALFTELSQTVLDYSRHRADEVARQRAEYLAGLTHQMRSPLLSLSLCAELLERDPLGLDPRVVDRLRRNVDRLRHLVDGVMRLERFEPHELPVRPRPVRPAHLVQEILRERECEAARKGLRLEARVDPGLTMRFDPELFRDALDNLVENALRYTPAGFVRIEVDDSAAETDVLFRVEDSGPGIPPERQQKLFSPIRSTSTAGVGIGLTVAHRAVTAQGGTLGLHSEPGKGSRFWFRLPRRVVASNLD
jgi:signal transduction histidine kinase